MKKSYFKIILPSVISILLFTITIFLYVIPQFQENIMDGKREMIKELTNSAWSILAKYENDEKNGLLTREEAQKTAISRIQYLRYGEEFKDYFWITDLHPIMVMHPYRTDLNGSDLSNFTDPHGKKLFVEFVKLVKQKNHGYVDYMWQWKDDSAHIVPKLSYVKIFKPWGWVIGTGIYIEDVKKEIKTLTKKLLWISVCISLLIAFLLIFITQQSIKIEQKRINAEKELNKSKEKYKTLVEAATEGLIMITNGKISFVNHVIAKLLGYEHSEIIDYPIRDFISDKNTVSIHSIFAENSFREGQFEVYLKKKNGGEHEVIITSSQTKLFHEIVNILIIKDISVDKSFNISNIDYQFIINSLNIGFFKIKLDLKGKFIYANETALKIFGIANLKQMHETNILELLKKTDDRKNLRKLLIENSFIKNKIIKIQQINGNTIIANLTLVINSFSDEENLIADGIIEDITQLETERNNINNVISNLKANNKFLENSIHKYIKEIFYIDIDNEITDAIILFQKKKTDCLLVSKNTNEIVGIVTKFDIQNRYINLELKPDNPIYLLMSSPLKFINNQCSIYELLKYAEDNKINHVLIKDNNQKIIGVIDVNDILLELKNSLLFYISNVSNAESCIEIKSEYLKFRTFIIHLINSGISGKYITSITSSFSDKVIEKLIAFGFNKYGEAPVPFAFLCFGSEGRKEETLYTDQDNAIVFEDSENKQDEEIQKYFLKLGSFICDELNEIGYSYCKGNIMAKNKNWCQALSVWKNYFANWLQNPESKNLLDATIFFDLRTIYGTESFEKEIRLHTSNLLTKNSVFLYHMANQAIQLKMPNFTSGNLIFDKYSEYIDLKSISSIMVMFIRIYAIKHNCFFHHSLDRLDYLNHHEIISNGLMNELQYSFNFIIQLRLKNQTALIEQKLAPSNFLDIKNVTEIEVSIIKKIISLLQSVQQKLTNDFRVTH